MSTQIAIAQNNAIVMVGIVTLRCVERRAQTWADQKLAGTAGGADEVGAYAIRQKHDVLINPRQSLWWRRTGRRIGALLLGEIGVTRSQPIRVIVGVEDESQIKLPLIVQTGGPTATLLGPDQGRQQQSRKHSNDADDDQQLQEREALRAAPKPSAWNDSKAHGEGMLAPIRTPGKLFDASQTAMEK